MKTALVMGISGGFGSHVATELLKQGWKVCALGRGRSQDKVPEELKGVEFFQGDAANIDDVRRAAKDVNIIVYGISPANYNWENKALPWLNVTATVAEEAKITLVFPGNVYVFNPDEGPEFSESSPTNPITELGRIRQKMESRLKQASENGANVILIRMGDFIGRHAPSTWVKQLIKPTKKGYCLTMPGPENLKHSWAYLPDVAKVVVHIVDNSPAESFYNVFHFKGYQFSFRELATTIESVSGKPVVLKSFPWFVIRTISPFSRLMRGLLMMRYLWEKEINLDESKFLSTFDTSIKLTSLGDALIESDLIEGKKSYSTKQNGSLQTPVV